MIWSNQLRCLLCAGGSEMMSCILHGCQHQENVSWIGYDTDSDSSITGFIRWCSSTKTGTLVIMKFDEQAILQMSRMKRVQCIQW